MDILTGTPPAPFDAGERYFGTDLAFMSMAALQRERAVIRLRLALDAQPHWWWSERLAQIEQELDHRA